MQIGVGTAGRRIAPGDAIEVAGYGVQETGVPVVEGEEVVKQRHRTDNVRVVRMSLRVVEEGPVAAYLYQAETSEKKMYSNTIALIDILVGELLFQMSHTSRLNAVLSVIHF